MLQPPTSASSRRAAAASRAAPAAAAAAAELPPDPQPIDVTVKPQTRVVVITGRLGAWGCASYDLGTLFGIYRVFFGQHRRSAGVWRFAYGYPQFVTAAALDSGAAV